jgi:hypothetical protein
LFVGRGWISVPHLIGFWILKLVIITYLSQSIAERTISSQEYGNFLEGM